MNKEIKEILDNLIRYKNDDDKMKWSPEDILTIEDVWLLLDYITNLQEENKELLEKFSNKIKEVANLIKENEKLKLAKDTKCASEILCECLHNDYKSRINKAIGYINKCRDYHKTYHSEDKMFADELTSLIMVLQGSDKNGIK